MFIYVFLFIKCFTSFHFFSLLFIAFLSSFLLMLLNININIKMNKMDEIKKKKGFIIINSNKEVMKG